MLNIRQQALGRPVWYLCPSFFHHGRFSGLETVIRILDDFGDRSCQTSAKWIRAFDATHERDGLYEDVQNHYLDPRNPFSVKWWRLFIGCRWDCL